MNPLNLPEVDDTQIIDTFKNQILQNGETTTLDVKNELRAQGFWVTQMQVSGVVSQFADQSMEFDWDVSNGHRVYREAVSPAPMSTGITPYVAKPKTQASLGDWEVGGSGTLKTYYNVTRNKARYEYAKEFGIDYVDTTARKM